MSAKHLIFLVLKTNILFRLVILIVCVWCFAVLNTWCFYWRRTSFKFFFPKQVNYLFLLQNSCYFVFLIPNYLGICFCCRFSWHLCCCCSCCLRALTMFTKDCISGFCFFLLFYFPAEHDDTLFHLFKKESCWISPFAGSSSFCY